MRFCAVNDLNEEYFDSAIGGLYREGRPNRLFFGAVDEKDGGAAGAVALEAAGDTLRLIYIGVEDARRRQGFGAFLLRECTRFAGEKGFLRLCCSFYEKPEEIRENELALFLKACGFRIEPAPVERQVYLLSEIYRAEKHLFEKEDQKLLFRRGTELDENERRELILLSLQEEGGISYLDEELLFSEENRYGGIMYKDDVPCASAAVVPFLDGVRLDQLYGTGKQLGAVRSLLKNCVSLMKEEPGLKRLYLDVGGEKLLRLQKQLFKKAELLPEECLLGYVAVKGTGEN